jgi:subtilisin family serine protease
MMTRSRLALPVALTAALLVSACNGGGSKSTPAPSPTPTGLQSAFVCPATAAAAETARSGGEGRGMRRVEAARAPREASTATNLYAVTYDRSFARSAPSSIASRETRAGATFVRQFDFSHIGKVTRIVAFAEGQAPAGLAALRKEPGVREIAPAGSRRYRLKVSQPYYTNDPYFAGFPNPVPTASGGTTPPATYHVPPYDENSSVPGQWDMHVTGLGYAFEYSQSGNGSSVPPNPSALGNANVKVAVIDTGEDSTHPELTPKIIYQKCFVSDQNGQNQTSSSFATDPQGHGTDVAGIAAAASNNGLGFAGAGGAVSVLAYRVFPTPDDACATGGSGDPQCGAASDDIASAIEDAIAQHANVINMSLGGSACTGGQDSDPTEGKAVADAIAANVVVVAASGNSAPTTTAVNAPACDPGVIAVGATSLADGQPNGAGNSNGSASSPTEYVASYSDFGTPGSSPGSASAWGIVAPGGDPNGGSDSDDLHWIEDIWTSTPFMSSSTDTSFTGTCTGDYPSDTGTTDCRVLIAGTSQATPHVAGAAALILSVNSGYQNPTAMKTLLCTTADNIADPNQGCGRLNVYRAMAKALVDTNPP